MTRKIAVLGAGANGASIGADLTRAGEDVLLIEQWPAHVEAMRANGLLVNMPDESQRTDVRTMHLCEGRDAPREVRCRAHADEGVRLALGGSAHRTVSG